MGLDESRVDEEVMSKKLIVIVFWKILQQWSLLDILECSGNIYCGRIIAPCIGHNYVSNLRGSLRNHGNQMCMRSTGSQKQAMTMFSVVLTEVFSSE